MMLHPELLKRAELHLLVPVLDVSARSFESAAVRQVLQRAVPSPDRR